MPIIENGVQYSRLSTKWKEYEVGYGNGARKVKSITCEMVTGEMAHVPWFVIEWEKYDTEVPNTIVNGKFVVELDAL